MNDVGFQGSDWGSSNPNGITWRTGVRTLAIFLAAPWLASAAIGFDASSNLTTVNNGTTFSWNHTMGSNPNRVLWVACNTIDNTNGKRISGITYNGVGLTKKQSVTGSVPTTEYSTWLLKDASLTSGTHAIQVTIASPGLGTGAYETMYCSAVSLYGVDQTTPYDAVATSTTALTHTPSVAITTVTDKAFLLGGWQVWGVNFDPVAEGTGQTSLQHFGSGQGVLLGGAFSYRGAVTPAGSNSLSWANHGSDSNYSMIAEAFRPAAGAACTVSTSSLAGASMQVPYSQTISTSNCNAPVFTISSGALPPGLSLGSGTGTISGTVATNAGSPYSFTVAVSDANGNPAQSLSIVVAGGSAPVISNASVAAHSPTSALCSWTTDTKANSTCKCGTSSGGPYTYATSTTVDAIQPGVSEYYGVLSHAVAVTGLATNTAGNAYNCVMVSTNLSGTTTSAEFTTGTLAAASSTPVAIASISPPTRINDQSNGANGMPNNGTWIDGDTQYSTWAADGNTYGLYQDGLGVKGVNINGGLGFVRWDAAHLVPTQLQNLGVGLGGDPFSEQGPISVRGIQYAFLSNGYGGYATGQTCCFNVLKSTDNWTTSISPQRNTGPATAGVAGLDVPQILSATISAASWSGGTNTLTVSPWSVTPPTNTKLYISGSGACDGFHNTTATSSTSVAFPSANVSCGSGTVQYMRSMSQTTDLPGDAGVKNDLLSPIQPCQDYSINCTWVANMDGWVYLFGLYKGLLRVRVEDLPLQDYSKYQCYAGTQNGDDGLYDANWVGATVGNCKALTVAAGQWDPYAYMMSTADKGQIAYIPDFNRFVLSVYIGANNCALGSAIFDLGPYPWGKPVLIGSINRDLRFPGLCPGFPNPLLASYQKVSANPLVSTITWVTSGGSFKGTRAAGSSDSYSPFLWRVRLVARGAAASRPLLSANGGGGRHTSNGLQLFYNFQDLTGGLQIPDLSPNDQTGKWTYTAPNNNPPVSDRYGLTLVSISGSPDNTTDGLNWSGQQQNLTMTTPFNTALNSYTAFACFGHYPYQVNGATINNGQVGEQVLSKNGGDLSIVRHGSTYGAGASWDVTVHGVLVGSVPIPDGTFGCIAARLNGTTATVYQSGAIAKSLPLTPTAGPVAVNSSGAAGNLVLGGTTSLWGILSELLIYDRALSDVELIHEMGVIRREMASRWITIDSVSLN